MKLSPTMKRALLKLHTIESSEGYATETCLEQHRGQPWVATAYQCCPYYTLVFDRLPTRDALISRGLVCFFRGCVYLSPAGRAVAAECAA